MNESDATSEAMITVTDSPVPALVARLYAESTTPFRSKLMACLLGAVGPLALAALAEGRFARFLFRSPSSAALMSAEEVRLFSESQVLELARYVSQACPTVFMRIAEMLQAEDPMLARTLAGGLLVIAIRAWTKGPRPPG